MDFETHRSGLARGRAEQALLQLVRGIGAERDRLVVIGGLNPDLLTAAAPVPHLGTTDVDVLIEVGLIFDRDDDDYRWLDEAVRQAKFEPVGDEPAWRWRATVDDAPVKVEFLCDVPDSRQQAIVLPGARRVVAMNLDGPAPALSDTQRRDVPRSDGSNIGVRFAGLGGYLAAKAAAVLARGLPKDHYDFVYVVLFNTAGGPGGAAAAVRHLAVETWRRDPVSDVLAAAELLLADDSEALSAYTAEMESAGSLEDDDFVELDAVAGLRELAALLKPTS